MSNVPVLENSTLDNAMGNALDSSPVWGYIVNGRLDIPNLKEALDKVVQHFPIFKARMHRDGKNLILTDKPAVSWTVIGHEKLLAQVFDLPPKSDKISVTPWDTIARANFYIPLTTTTVRRPSIADENTPLIEIRVQTFLDKTVIGLTWNHLLTDGGGMSFVVSAWTKVLRGESLPDMAPLDNPFKPHYSKNPTPPLGSVVPNLSKKVRVYYRAISDLVQYGKPEPRSIFIPCAIFQEWKKNSDGVSTNDLITAWLFKGWASTAKPSIKVSIVTVIDLRGSMPDIVPALYHRNAASARAAPRTLSAREINKMTQLELAKVIRSFVKSYTPETELNFQSYELLHIPDGQRIWPEAHTALALSSWSKFGIPQMDFGAETESFEGFQRLNRPYGNAGSVWMEDGGARISFWMNKKRWNRGIWKEWNNF